jgi:hypothetical protein
VRLTADARRARGDTEIRFTASEGASASYVLPAQTRLAAYVSWQVTPSSEGPTNVDRGTYEAARETVLRYWQRRLAEGLQIGVPERGVVDAERAVLIQNLGLTWRYSVGNPYQEFSYPEGIDVAQVLSAYGRADEARAILARSLRQRPTRYPNWQMGQKLVGVALYYRLFRDRDLVKQATPVLERYVADLGRQVTTGGRGLLRRERYSSDVADRVFGLHSQAVVWQGLLAMARVWRETGHNSLAARCGLLARRLEAGLRDAIHDSRMRLPDGSLFVDVRLLGDVRTYDRLTASRFGSYWNLVMPYALASGLFPPGGAEAAGLLRYMLGHGSRLLGLVRSGAYALYGRAAVFPESGVNPVYGLNVSRFLADNGEADQLVLSLYGYLALAMASGTFVSGEAVSVAPLGGAFQRAMYLPPNGASNASFLETLHLMLVHETRGRNGIPRGLELAFSTPRAWLRPGKQIVVRDAPTSFGPLSYSIAARTRSVRVGIDLPGRREPRTIRLRLRLPSGGRMSEVTLDGHRFARFDRASATIDLTGLAGHHDLAVRVTRP